MCISALPEHILPGYTVSFFLFTYLSTGSSVFSTTHIYWPRNLNIGSVLSTVAVFIQSYTVFSVTGNFSTPGMQFPFPFHDDKKPYSYSQANGIPQGMGFP